MFFIKCTVINNLELSIIERFKQSRLTGSEGVIIQIRSFTVVANLLQFYVGIPFNNLFPIFLGTNTYQIIVSFGIIRTNHFNRQAFNKRVHIILHTKCSSDATTRFLLIPRSVNLCPRRFFVRTAAYQNLSIRSQRAGYCNRPFG